MGLANGTFGLMGGFLVLPLPQLLAAEHVTETRIAAISAACFSWGIWVFLLGPLLDLRFSRRWYATAFALLAGAGLAAAILLRAHLAAFEAAIMLAYAAATLSSNALGGWLATLVPEDDHGGVIESRLGAWTQVATLGGNGIMTIAAGELLREVSPMTAALLLGALVACPALIFLWMPVPQREVEQARRLASHFGEFWRQLGSLLKQREVLLTLALFLAPTGSFSLTNTLGGVAGDFHASEAFVSRVGGLMLTIAGATGCLLVPVLARRLRPLALYLGIGAAGCVFTLLMLLPHRTPTTFAIAFLGENVFQAMSFTAAVAICLRAIGRDNPLAATEFGLLTAATVLPISYMGVLDGHSYARGIGGLHGLAGMFAVDGGVSLVACVVMFAVMRWLGDESRHTSTSNAG
ncbi:MFS transporter, PAT family, beta-lactamase induction signal transducer AmpG [Bryocella elongata]|uniref:MFS transporter, PAT family, beta-lactamase induction signal transducer AmpG n=2 Tax=Bryocella elongata TaxID=863522 RepID=A0A1H5VZS2_9BACT|nr:MFS transporter, PAT family, beta-lactamase induction signal transducer AmpG [Bryocella elongata]